MEADHEKCARLLVALESLVEEECFAATRGDWDDVRAVQQRTDPLLQSLAGLLASGVAPAHRERMAPRLQVLQRQHTEILAHIDGHKSRLAARLAAVEAAAGRLAGMRRAYASPAKRRGLVPAALRDTA